MLVTDILYLVVYTHPLVYIYIYIYIQSETKHVYIFRDLRFKSYQYVVSFQNSRHIGHR